MRAPGKSLLQDYAHLLPPETLRPLIEQLIRAARQPEGASGWELAHAIELETVRLDSTCVKTNIHFPADWVLMCDAVRTLMKSTRLIRAPGIPGAATTGSGFGPGCSILFRAFVDTCRQSNQQTRMFEMENAIRFKAFGLRERWKRLRKSVPKR